MNKAAAFGVIVLLICALCFVAYKLGYLPLPKLLQITTSSNSSSSNTTSTTATATTSSSSSSSSAPTIKIFNYTISLKPIAQWRDTAKSVFIWLLGDNLLDAILNLFILLIIIGIVYVLSKFIKFVILAVVALDAILILLHYGLKVI